MSYPELYTDIYGKLLVTRRFSRSFWYLGCRNFLTNITVRLVLKLYEQNNIIQNNSRLKTYYKIVYFSLKNVSLRGIGTREGTKCQYFNSLISRKGKFFGKPIWFDVKTYFFRIESIFCKLFLNRLISKFS